MLEKKSKSWREIAFLLFTFVDLRRSRILMRSVRFPPFGFVMKEIWSTLIYRMQFLHKDIFGKMWCMTICSNEELNGTVWFQCRLLILTFVTNFFIRGEVVFFSSRISVNYGHKLRLVAKKIKRNYIRKLRYLWWELVLVRAVLTRHNSIWDTRPTQW